MNDTYEYKNLKMCFDSEFWEPVENYMGSLVTFFLTEKGRIENDLEGFQPCVSFAVYENIQIGIKLIFNNTCRDLKKYMQDLEIMKQHIQGNTCNFTYKGMNSNHAITCRQVIKKINNDVVSITGGCSSEKFERFDKCIESLLEGFIGE